MGKRVINQDDQSWAEYPEYQALRSKLNHAWMRRVYTLIKQVAEEAYEKGSTDRKK